MKMRLKEKVCAIRERLQLRVNFATTAIVSAVLIGLSFALYLPSLGWYLDDWPQLYSLVVRGTEGIKTYFLYDDRPFGWWPDLLVYKVWGTNPVGWHLTNYLMRWLVGLGIWGVFSQLWKNRKREVFWAVQVFAVFPLFNQQSMGTTFIAHWFCYALFFLSLYLMVMAVNKPRLTWIWLALALAANAANLFTYENFIGVEFLRPVILCLALRGTPKKQRIRKTLLYWLPFLALAIFYVVWRVFLMENVRGLDPVLLRNLLSKPGDTLLDLGNYALRDLVFMLVTVWYPTLDPASINLKSPSLVLAGGLTLVVIAVLVFLALWRKPAGGAERNGEEKDFFAAEAIVLGFLGVLFGLATGWLVDRSLTAPGLWNDRFGFPGMWAAPLFLVGMLQLLFRRETAARDLVLIVLIGLAVGRNFAVTNDYRWSTTWQNRFASQLKWRAPEIKDDTVLLADNELFLKMGVYPTSFMINLVYPDQQAEFIRADHWFLTLNKYFPDNVDELDDGIGIYQQHWYVKFAGWSTNSLVINWNRSGTDCLWMLTSNDRYNPVISENTRRALGASNLDSILADSDMPWPDEHLFGAEDRNTWCYYYQTADLARQQGQWDQVTAIYQQAGEAGYKSQNGVELIPFIEGYARTGQADKAAELTVLAQALTPNMRNYTCDTWNRLAEEIHGDTLFDAEYKAFSEKDMCWEVK